MEILDEPHERLKELLRRSEYDSVAELARAMNKPAGTLAGHFNGARGVSAKMARVYARRLKSTPEYILYGKQLNQLTDIAAIKGEIKLEPYKVPLLSCTDLRQWGLIVAGETPMSEETVFAPNEQSKAERTTAFIVEDDAMEGNTKDSISKGEYVFVDPDAKARPGCLVVAIAPDFDHVIVRKYSVKSIGEGGRHRFDLTTFNPDFPGVIDAHDKGVRIVGRVVGAYRVF